MPASFIVTRARVYWSKRSDYKGDIIEEYNLKEFVAGKLVLVRVELTPPNMDFHRALDQWQFEVAQDLLPDWWDATDAERRTRAVLPEWVEACVHLNGTVEAITQASSIRYIAGGTVEHIYSGTVKYIYGGTVKCIAGGTVECIAGGTVKYIYGGTIECIAGGTVEYIAGGTVKCIAGGTVENIYAGTVEYIYGGTVERIYGGTVERIGGQATVTTYQTDISLNIEKSSQAVWIDRSGDKPVCRVGGE